MYLASCQWVGSWSQKWQWWKVQGSSTVLLTAGQNTPSGHWLKCWRRSRSRGWTTTPLLTFAWEWTTKRFIKQEVHNVTFNQGDTITHDQNADQAPQEGQRPNTWSFWEIWTPSSFISLLPSDYIWRICGPAKTKLNCMNKIKIWTQNFSILNVSNDHSVTISLAFKPRTAQKG